MPAEMVAQAFHAARAAWKNAGREGSPRLVGIAYYAFSDVDQGRDNVRDYCSSAGQQIVDIIDTSWA